jgi:hypothetical protein
MGCLRLGFDGHLVRGVSGEGVTPAFFDFQREKGGGDYGEEGSDRRDRDGRERGKR